MSMLKIIACILTSKEKKYKRQLILVNIHFFTIAVRCIIIVHKLFIDNYQRGAIMFKRVWIILPMLIIKQLHGMEEPHFLSRLPVVIWNLIAQYLTFNDVEIEEEFIERTKNEALECPKNLAVNWGDEVSLISYCSRVRKVGKLCGIGEKECLIIFNEKMDQEFYRKPIKSKSYGYFILSSDADMFVTTHSENEPSYMHKGYEIISYKTVLTIAAVHGQQEQEFI